MIYDAIIIGAGASGYLCAISALRNKKKVLIIDKENKPLRKTAISGGGRCNYTNSVLNSGCYNTDFCSYALKLFNNNDISALLGKHGIKPAVKNKTQLFSNKGAEAVVRALEKETSSAKKIYGSDIHEIKKNKLFEVRTTAGKFNSQKIVIATGGLSFPQLGATDFGYKVARQFGLKVAPPRPGLTAMNLDSKTLKHTSALQGISIKAHIKTKTRNITDDVLFTHFGLSGPAILQSSLDWRDGENILINFSPDINFEFLLKEKRQTSKGIKIRSVINKYFPEKLAEFFTGSNDVFISEASNKVIHEIAERINAWRIVPTGTRGFKSAEITIGGVDTSEINPKTMEAVKVKGLFFVGEVLDVTGQLGGYNLQWAWSSGWTAGKEI